MKKIALLPEGTVSHEAVRYLFQDEPVEFKHFKQISDVFLSVVDGEVDYSVIPIENTIEGSVSLHMDWLVHEVNMPMQLEWVYPSIQHLIGDMSELAANGEMDFGSIKRVLSHPVAMAQCQQFIRHHMPQAELENVGSTAEAIESASLHRKEGWAAIGTALGAERFKLDILASRITDHHNNFTRFVLIGPKALEVQSRPDCRRTSWKTSVLITLPADFPGALHQVLSAFAWRKLNLSRIESRPTKKKLGSYYFYIDVLEKYDSTLLIGAIGEIEALGCQVRSLGSYPSYSYGEIQAEVQL